MSMYGLAMCSHDDPDPWLACTWGVTDHTHYHDCVNCDRARNGGCEYGAVRLQQSELEKQKEESQRMIAEITEFCNTDFVVEDALHVARKLNTDKKPDHYDF